MVPFFILLFSLDNIIKSLNTQPESITIAGDLMKNFQLKTGLDLTRVLPVGAPVVDEREKCATAPKRK